MSDRTLWPAIIGGVGSRVSGKANFLAARELIKFTYFSLRPAARRVSLDALANC